MRCCESHSNPANNLGRAQRYACKSLAYAWEGIQRRDDETDRLPQGTFGEDRAKDPGHLHQVTALGCSETS